MKRIVFLLVVVLASSCLVAQECYSIKRQHAVVLPDSACNLSVVDGRLFFYSAGLLLSSPVASGVVYAMEGDTAFMHFDEEMNYVVRQPRTNTIYYTALKRGRSQLYTINYRPGKSPKLSKVKIPGARYGICHPSFSADGRYIIFSSTFPNGRKVLMYSHQDLEGKWSTAMQLGSSYSMSFSETAPVVHNGYVYYAASDTTGRWQLYAARLLMPIVIDGVETEPILGRAAATPLPTPFASNGSNFEMAVDTINGRLYILSSRSGCQALYLYNNALPVVSYSGKVEDIAGIPLDNVSVSVFESGQLLCRTYSNSDGMFQLLLPANNFADANGNFLPPRHYTFWLTKDGFFGNTVEFSAVQIDENNAVSYYQSTTRLDQLDLSSTLYISDVYGSEANIELTTIGKQKLQRIVRFLYDNPQISMQVVLSSSVVDDAEFNTLITDSRLEMLRRFFEIQLPSTKVEYLNAHSQSPSSVNNRFNSRLAISFK